MTDTTAPDSNHLAAWKGVTYDKRCLDARFQGGHSKACLKCATKDCCGHCIADGLRTLAEIDARKAQA